MRTAAWPFAIALLGACAGQGAPLGANEPIRVRGGQLIQGPLPEAPDGIAVTTVQSLNAVVLPGQGGKKLSGRAGDAASAIAMRLDDIGTGYWVLPMGPGDPQYPNELTWEASIDFSATIAPGLHFMRFVAIDRSGHPGPVRELQVCIASPVPDNLNACDPTAAPPEAVITLKWDSDVDLDLEVVTGAGRRIDAKHPTSLAIDGGRPGDDVGVIDRDSLAQCIPDGRRQENLIFQKRPPSGGYDVYANLFDACRAGSVRFTLVVYEADGDPPNRRLQERYRKSGRLGELDANGGAANGLFIVEYPF